MGLLIFYIILIFPLVLCCLILFKITIKQKNKISKIACLTLFCLVPTYDIILTNIFAWYYLNFNKLPIDIHYNAEKIKHPNSIYINDGNIEELIYKYLDGINTKSIGINENGVIKKCFFTDFKDFNKYEELSRYLNDKSSNFMLSYDENILKNEFFSQEYKYYDDFGFMAMKNKFKYKCIDSNLNEFNYFLISKKINLPKFIEYFLTANSFEILDSNNNVLARGVELGKLRYNIELNFSGLKVIKYYKSYQAKEMFYDVFDYFIG